MILELPVLFDEMNAAVDMLWNVVIFFIVTVKDHMERNVFEWVAYIFVMCGILVYAEVVITARIPYYFKIAAFWAPYTFPRKRPPN